MTLNDFLSILVMLVVLFWFGCIVFVVAIFRTTKNTVKKGSIFAAVVYFLNRKIR